MGAAGYFATPVFNGAATATIEPSSSAGGKPILFMTAGVRINGIVGTVRQKPEITAVDGGITPSLAQTTKGTAFLISLAPRRLLPMLRL